MVACVAAIYISCDMYQFLANRTQQVHFLIKNPRNYLGPRDQGAKKKNGQFFSPYVPMKFADENWVYKLLKTSFSSDINEHVPR
jgi:hypothetical protein